MQINAKAIFSIIVMAIGLIFYIAWSLTYNAWLDIGIYSVTIIFVASGALGFMISQIKEES
jgi:VIT1/CCC1 family predicted Fe2+/Mn2+ transporter